MKELLLGLYYLKLKYILLLLIFLPFISKAQMIKVVDKIGKPIEGVAIYSSNENIAVSDENGEFILVESINSKELTFLLIGYETQVVNIEVLLKSNRTVILKNNDLELDKVIIVGRNQQYRDDIISETDIITQRNIQITNSPSTADALAMSGNIFVQKSQFGGGSPVLRGFEANRVLLVLDGVRMNNAIYRSGHLQNAITVDNFALKRIEVIFGPGSLTYGSDAIGGVIHFKTKDPIFNTKFLDYKFRYSSASNEKTGFIGLNYGRTKFASELILSYSDFSDLRSGSVRPAKYSEFGKRNHYVSTVNGIDKIIENKDYNLQKGTGFSQYNLMSKSIYKFNRKTKLTANFQFSTSSKIPRYDFLTEKKGNDFKYAEWYYGPQSRLFGSLQLDLSNINSIYDNAVVIAAIQKVKEDRINRKFNSNWRFYNREDLVVFSLSVDFKKYLKYNKNHELVYGMDFQNNDLNSNAKRENILTKEVITDVLSRYPSAVAQNFRLGGYVQYVFGEKDYPYQISFGTRAETNHISVKYKNDGLIDWPISYFQGLKNNNTSYAFSLGAKYEFSKDWKLSGNISTAFRNPNIDDLSKIRVKKGEFLIPNLELSTEKSNNVELSVRKSLTRKNLSFNFSVTGFYTVLNDAIIRKEFKMPNGSKIYIDGLDTLKVVSNQNAEKEKVYGVSIGFETRFRKVKFSSNMVYTKGDLYADGKDIGPAPHIPPLFGNIKIGYSAKDFTADYIFIYNAKKPIELYGGSVDNPENATIDGSYAWSTHNIYLEYKLSKSLKVNIALENILDIHYRSFSSGVSGAGRSLILGISGRLYGE